MLGFSWKGGEASGDLPGRLGTYVGRLSETHRVEEMESQALQVLQEDHELSTVLPTLNLDYLI